MIFQWIYQTNQNCMYFNLFFSVIPARRLVGWVMFTFKIQSRHYSSSSKWSHTTKCQVSWPPYIQLYIFYYCLCKGILALLSFPMISKSNPYNFFLTMFILFLIKLFIISIGWPWKSNDSTPDSCGLNFKYCCTEVRSSCLLMEIIVFA